VVVPAHWCVFAWCAAPGVGVDFAVPGFDVLLGDGFVHLVGQSFFVEVDGEGAEFFCIVALTGSNNERIRCHSRRMGRR
jgi:hypothetical protein